MKKKYRKDVLDFMDREFLRSMMPYFIVLIAVDFLFLYLNKDGAAFIFATGILILIWIGMFHFSRWYFKDRYYPLAKIIVDADKDFKKMERRRENEILQKSH